MVKRTSAMNPPTKQQKNDGDLEDLIGQLPDHILGSIISQLSLKEAGRCSILSKRWRYLWTYLPQLDFDADHTLQKLNNVAKTYRNLKKKRVAYVNWVNQVLEGYNCSSIEVLRIHFDLNLKWRSEIDRWVKFAMERRVNILELNLLYHRRFPRQKTYLFPTIPSVEFSCYASLTVLKLGVDVDEQVLESFLCNCPCLERLYVDFSKSLVNLRVKSCALKLKHLELFRCNWLKSLQVSAPNLASFIYCGPDIGMPLDNTPKVTEISLMGYNGRHAPFDMFKLTNYCSQLRKLTVDFKADNGFTGNIRGAEYPLFNNLEELVLLVNADGGDTLLGFTSLIKKCPLLHKFGLEISCFEYVVERSPMEIEKVRLEHMKVVEILGFVGMPLDIEVVLFFASNAAALENIRLDTKARDADGIICVLDTKKNIKARKRFANTLKHNFPGTVEFVIA